MSNEKPETRREITKNLDVVNAIIVENGRLLAMQRGFGSQAGGWEFPGGKVNPDENPEEALIRAIGEKLDASIEIDSFAFSVEIEHDGILMHTHSYLCHLMQGQRPHLQEHTAARWLDSDTLHNVGWLPSDSRIVEIAAEKGLI